MGQTHIAYLTTIYYIHYIHRMGICKTDIEIDSLRGVFLKSASESTTTRIAGGLDFTAIGGKRQGREVPRSLRVKPGAKHPV
jgi:hypothetical protein